MKKEFTFPRPIYWILLLLPLAAVITALLIGLINPNLSEFAVANAEMAIYITVFVSWVSLRAEYAVNAFLSDRKRVKLFFAAYVILIIGIGLVALFSRGRYYALNAEVQAACEAWTSSLFVTSTEESNALYENYIALRDGAFGARITAGVFAALFFITSAPSRPFACRKSEEKSEE